jgi:hypothetical protein
MDAHDSVRAKVDAIFRELVGDRATQLRGNVNARRANDILGQALAEDLDPLKADQLAFNLVDWNSDAAFLVGVILFPERFTPEELRVGVDMFLIHAPNHILTAARLGGYEAKDLDLDENAI